jgi:hypothetical protein
MRQIRCADLLSVGSVSTLVCPRRVEYPDPPIRARVHVGWILHHVPAPNPPDIHSTWSPWRCCSMIIRSHCGRADRLVGNVGDLAWCKSRQTQPLPKSHVKGVARSDVMPEHFDGTVRDDIERQAALRRRVGELLCGCLADGNEQDGHQGCRAAPQEEAEGGSLPQPFHRTCTRPFTGSPFASARRKVARRLCA